MTYAPPPICLLVTCALERTWRNAIVVRERAAAANMMFITLNY